MLCLQAFEISIDMHFNVRFINSKLELRMTYKETLLAFAIVHSNVWYKMGYDDF